MSPRRPPPKKPPGTRAGRRPIRVHPATALELGRLIKPRADSEDLLGPVPGYTLEQISVRLNTLEMPTRAGHDAGAWDELIDESLLLGIGRGMAEELRWTPSKVRAAIRAMRTARLQLLQRLGSMLYILDATSSFPSGFMSLCKYHQVNSWWIWDRYQLPHLLERRAASRRGRVEPPVSLTWPTTEHPGGRVTVTAFGRTVLRLYGEIAPLSHVANDVLSQLRGCESFTQKQLRKIIAFYAAPQSAVQEVERHMQQHPSGGLCLNDEGAAAAEAWHAACVEADPRKRWDRILQPTQEELDVLPTDWDWDDRPPIPPAN